MLITYSDLKKALYLLQTIVGFILIAAAIFLFDSPVVVESVTHFISGAIVFVSGVTCVIFGIESILLRDDPDILR